MTDSTDPASYLRSQIPDYSAAKFGRLPRRFNPLVPKMAAAQGLLAPAPPPPACDYTVGMPLNLEMLQNDVLSDCTAAAVLHAQQVWSFNSNPPMVSVTDAEAIELYSASSGYVPGNPATDQGGDEQTVLTYWLNNSVAGNKLAAFVEVDVKDTDAVKSAIFGSGCVYVGFDVPAWLDSPQAKAPGATWALQPAANNSIIGGHAVVLAGYDDMRVIVISWGAKYFMTWGFFGQFMDEVYALADTEWVKQTGQTPGGVPLDVLEQQMQALKPKKPWWKLL
jgi:hypothetical protein